MFDKPLKTRIKKTTTKNGEIEYTAQYRSMFCWYRFSEYDVTILSHTRPRTVWITSMYSDRSKDIKEIKALIDEYLAEFKENGNVRDGEKVVSTEYIEYP